MIIARTIRGLRDRLAELPGTVGFVPTMGALHEGHLSLIELASRHADHVVVSIFVNPTQFDRAADLASYPRDEAGDLARCADAGVDLAFVPEVDELYPDGPRLSTSVSVHGLDDNLCGRTRPGHFDGVTTIVAKLFNLVRPDVAVFGQKDYQQLAIIRRMVRDLDFPVAIVGAPTLRERSGLAISSRNQLLDEEGQLQARSLRRGLVAAREAYDDGERSAEALEAVAREAMESGGLRVDYAECVDAHTLARLTDVGRDPAILAAAAFAGPVRLIDNIAL